MGGQVTLSTSNRRVCVDLALLCLRCTPAIKFALKNEATKANLLPILTPHTLRCSLRCRWLVSRVGKPDISFSDQLI